jgi:hypothetical protein
MRIAFQRQPKEGVSMINQLMGVRAMPKVKKIIEIQSEHTLAASLCLNYGALSGKQNNKKGV